MRLHQLIPEETQYQRSLQWQKDKDTESEAGSIVSDKGKIRKTKMLRKKTFNMYRSYSKVQQKICHNVINTFLNDLLQLT